MKKPAGVISCIERIGTSARRACRSWCHVATDAGMEREARFAWRCERCGSSGRGEGVGMLVGVGGRARLARVLPVPDLPVRHPLDRGGETPRARLGALRLDDPLDVVAPVRRAETLERGA